jgi:hypothetical protein
VLSLRDAPGWARAEERPDDHGEVEDDHHHEADGDEHDATC